MTVLSWQMLLWVTRASAVAVMCSGKPTHLGGSKTLNSLTVRETFGSLLAPTHARIVRENASAVSLVQAPAHHVHFMCMIVFMHMVETLVSTLSLSTDSLEEGIKAWLQPLSTVCAHYADTWLQYSQQQAP